MNLAQVGRPARRDKKRESEKPFAPSWRVRIAPGERERGRGAIRRHVDRAAATKAIIRLLDENRTGESL